MKTLLAYGIAFIGMPLIGAIFRLPVGLLLIPSAKAMAGGNLQEGASFAVGVIQDAIRWTFAVWLTVKCFQFVGLSLSWILVVWWVFLNPWLSWDRMRNLQLAPDVRAFEIGCNVGRVGGLLVGGLFFL